MRIEHEVLIEAPVATVWALTERVEDWPALTANFTAVRRLDGGPLRIGSRARVSQPGLGTRVWTVTALDPPEDPTAGRGTSTTGPGSPAAERIPRATFAWETRMPGVRMTATHLLAATRHGCRHTLTLEPRGLIAGLLGRLAGERMQAALETENAGMKAAAERRPG